MVAFPPGRGGTSPNVAAPPPQYAIRKTPYAAVRVAVHDDGGGGGGGAGVSEEEGRVLKYEEPALVQQGRVVGTTTPPQTGVGGGGAPSTDHLHQGAVVSSELGGRGLSRGVTEKLQRATRWRA